MTYGQQVLDDLRPETRELRKMIPDVYQGFGALHGAAFAAGRRGRTTSATCLAACEFASSSLIRRRVIDTITSLVKVAGAPSATDASHPMHAPQPRTVPPLRKRPRPSASRC